MLSRTSFEILSDRPGATAHGGLGARARITFNLYGSCRAAPHASVVVKRGTVGAENTNTSDVPAFEANSYFRSALEAVGPSRLTPFVLTSVAGAQSRGTCVEPIRQSAGLYEESSRSSLPHQLRWRRATHRI